MKQTTIFFKHYNNKYCTKIMNKEFLQKRILPIHGWTGRPFPADGERGAMGTPPTSGPYTGILVARQGTWDRSSCIPLVWNTGTPA